MIGECAACALIFLAGVLTGRNLWRPRKRRLRMPPPTEIEAGE